MKIILSFLLVIFSFVDIKCQELFHQGVTHYFHWDNDPNRILSYHVDSIVPVGDSVNYFFRPMTDHYLEPEEEICGLLICSLDIRGIPPLGDSCTKSANGVLKFHNYLHEEISFDLNIEQDDSSLFFQDDAQKFFIERLPDQEGVYLGVDDHFKYFQISHYDNIGNTVLSPLNNQIIQISENEGIISFPDIFTFPDTLRMFSLIGKEGIYGFHAPTYAEIYNFEVGDVFQFFSYGVQGSWSYNTQTILSKSYDSENNVTYSIAEYRQSRHLESIPVFPNWQEVWNFSSDTIVNNYSASEKIFIPPHDGRVRNSYVYEMVNGVNRLTLYWNYFTYGFIGCDLNCIGPTDKEGGFYRPIFREGFGRIYAGGTFDTYSMLYHYSLANGETFGSLYVVGIDEQEKNQVLIFPNPTTDELTLSFSYPSNGGELKVLDMSGRIVTVELIANGVSSTSLDFNAFPEGLYFIEYRDSNGITFFDKVIKNSGN